MVVFIIIKLSIADLSFLPAACISDMLLLLFLFSISFTISYTFDIMFTKSIPLWLSLIMTLLPPFYILLIVVFLHCASALCSLSMPLNKILRQSTIPSFPFINYSVLHPNLFLAVLFFSLAIAF